MYLGYDPNFKPDNQKTVVFSLVFGENMNRKEMKWNLCT